MDKVVTMAAMAAMTPNTGAFSLKRKIVAPIQAGIMVNTPMARPNSASPFPVNRLWTLPEGNNSCPKREFSFALGRTSYKRNIF